MLKQALILLIVALAEFGCDAEYGANLYPYRVDDLQTVRARLEREKRDLIKIENIKIGDGPLAAWGRRIKADIDVRYTDGTVIYQGPVVT